MNLTTHCGIVIVALVFGSTTGHAGDVKTYRDKGCTFAYPANFKISVKEHGQVIQLVSPNHSTYWEDAITIRKQDRKTEECEPPDGTLPGDPDRRKIAGLRAYGYSGEDAAMDRVVKIKGYVIETEMACWRFELNRKDRPFHKSDLPAKELKRLENLSNQDSKTANTAYRAVLDSFILLPVAK